MPICTKWPLLLVTGKPVTPEQADEILIRTQEWYLLFSNDKAWLRAVYEVAGEFGLPQKLPHQRTDDQLRAYWAGQQQWTERMNILPLHYLHNDQIMSPWIGGSHGWCDWQGIIGCGSYNIGKWPSDDEVAEDWAAIATAFPYLDLTAQVIDHQGGAPEIAGQWRVSGGRVEYTETPADFLDVSSDPVEILAPLRPGGEQGVSLDRLRSALVRVANGDPR